MDVLKELFALQDLQYKSFNASLIPTVDPDLIIGVRTPHLRSLAKKIGWDQEFTNNLPHKYYDENNLHAFMLCEIKDFDECIVKLNAFLPYIDNWATCDGLKPKCFKKSPQKLLPYIEKWLKSKHTYTVRFACLMLMTHFLGENFKEEYLEKVSCIRSNEYYINMMLAWYFAEALVKQYESAIIYLEERKLSPWVHKKTVQKACESFRITDEKKTYLRSLTASSPS